MKFNCHPYLVKLFEMKLKYCFKETNRACSSTGCALCHQQGVYQIPITSHAHIPTKTQRILTIQLSISTRRMLGFYIAKYYNKKTKVLVERL